MTAIRRWLSKSGTQRSPGRSVRIVTVYGHVLPVRAAGRRIRSARRSAVRANATVRAPP